MAKTLLFSFRPPTQWVPVAFFHRDAMVIAWSRPLTPSVVKIRIHGTLISTSMYNFMVLSKAQATSHFPANWQIFWISFWQGFCDSHFFKQRQLHMFPASHWVKDLRLFAVFLYTVYIIWEMEGAAFHIGCHTDNRTLLWLLVAMQDDLLDLIAGMQSKRMDEQRVALPHLPGLHPPAQSQVLRRLSVAGMGSDGSTTPDDTFLEMLMRCQVSCSSFHDAFWTK
jgi:hypothetical protein